MADVIQQIVFKRGTKAALEAKLVGDKKPLEGEPVFETDTNKFKIGDGVKNYADLPYISGESGEPAAYLRKAELIDSGKTLRLWNKDSTYVDFTPEGAVYTAGNGIKIEANVISIDETVVATKTYVDSAVGSEKTRAENIEAALSGRIATIEGDYLKAADKAELEGKVSAEKARAEGIESALSARVGTVEAGLSAEAEMRASVDAALSERIEALEGRGRFLSSWNCATGKPGDYPSIPVGETYNYKAGDYYLVSTIAASGNLRPAGTGIQHTTEGWVVPTASETEAVNVGDEYIYSTSGWVLVHTPEKQVVWGEIGGTLSNQTDLQAALNLKADKTYVDEQLALKADVAALSSEVSRAMGAEASLAAEISGLKVDGGDIN